MRYICILAVLLIPVLLNACSAKTNSQTNNPAQAPNSAITDVQQNGQNQNQAEPNTANSAVQANSALDILKKDSDKKVTAPQAAASGIVSSTTKEAKNASNKTSIKQQTAKSTQVGKAANSKKMGLKPTKGQNKSVKQFIRADLSGEVVSVSGNSVKIKVIESQSGPRPSGQKPDMVTNDSNRQNAGGQPPQRPQIKYTGETKTIKIPSSLTIKSGGRGESSSVKVKDLKAKDILQIWFSDKQKTTVSQARVMSQLRRKDF